MSTLVPRDRLDLDPPEPPEPDHHTCTFCNGIVGESCQCTVTVERRCARCLGPVVRFKNADGRPGEWCESHGAVRVSERHVHYPKGSKYDQPEPDVYTLFITD